MRAIILAAGQGTRLKPLTDDRPKCLVPLLGTTLLQRQLHALTAAGIQQIAIVAGYRADEVRAAAPTIEVFENPAFASTNMVASLFAARRWLESRDDLLIVYGDIVFESRLIDRPWPTENDVAVIVDLAWRAYWEARMADPLADAETLRVGADGFLTELGARPRTYDDIEGQYIGLFRIQGPALDRILRFHDSLDPASYFRGRALRQMHMTDFLQLLINHGFKVHAVPERSGWLEVDSVSDLALYTRLAAEGRLGQFCHLA